MVTVTAVMFMPVTPVAVLYTNFIFYLFTLTFVVEIAHHSNMIYVICFVSRYSCTSDTVLLSFEMDGFAMLFSPFQ